MKTGIYFLRVALPSGAIQDRNYMWDVLLEVEQFREYKQDVHKLHLCCICEEKQINSTIMGQDVAHL